MDQKVRFIADYQRRYFSLSELCARSSISRRTAYKWIDRYEVEGPEGLQDRSRRPHHCPHQTPAEAVAALLAPRRPHPSWGAKKLLRIVSPKHPDWKWPSRSTCSELLKRHGLVTKRRRRTHPSHPGRPMTPMDEPNAIWTADFKGQFRTRDGRDCYVRRTPAITCGRRRARALRSAVRVPLEKETSKARDRPDRQVHRVVGRRVHLT